MTKDQALRKAFEALDIVKIHFTQNRHVNDAINSIKEALAQPEQKRPQNCGTGYCSCIECVMEPEQEPDYWLGYGLQAHTEKPFESATPVWTKPPQREPLTRERLVAMADVPRGVQTFDDWVELFGREIEAAHGIGDKK